jgi:hypothetical protein
LLWWSEQQGDVVSIRLLARELYKLLQKVEKIEEEIRGAPADEQEALKERLRRLKAERNRVRRMLDGKKG